MFYEGYLFRYRRNDEYTSITDTITSQLARISENPDASGTCSTPPGGIVEIPPEEMFPEEPHSPLLERRGSLPKAMAQQEDGQMRRAKPSFVVRQNALLR